MPAIDIRPRTRPQSATTPAISANSSPVDARATAAEASTSTKLTPSTIGPMYSFEPVSTVDRERSCIRLMTTKIRPISTAAAPPAIR